MKISVLLCYFIIIFLILCNSRRVSRSERLQLHSRDCCYSFYPFELKVCRMVELCIPNNRMRFCSLLFERGFCVKKWPDFPRFKRFSRKRKWLVTAPNQVKMGKWWRIAIPLLHSDNDEESVRVCYCCHELLTWQMTCFVCL